MNVTEAPVIGGRTAAHTTPSRRGDTWPATGATTQKIGNGTAGVSRSTVTARLHPVAAPPRPLVCLVVDDWPTARNRLVGMLRAHARVAEVFIAPDALHALRLAHGTRVDVAFIEAGMQGMDGIELAWVLKRFAAAPALVLVGGTSGRAADAFDVGAVDYLPKPISEKRLNESLRRAINRGYGGAASVPGAGPNVGAGATMPVPTARGLTLLQLNAIRWAQAKGDYVRLYTSEGDHLIRASITWLAQRLAPHGMVRIHRSFLVQPRLIQMIRSGESGRLVVVIDGHQLPVSRRQAPALRQHLGLP